MNKFDEEIAMLENALKGALLVPNECTFVSSEVIKSCLDTLKTYESWENLIRYEIEEKVRADFAHDLKEKFNAEFPLNYPSTKPFFTLDNVRMIVEEQLKEQK